jgi:hypothetical protein
VKQLLYYQPGVSTRAGERLPRVAPSAWGCRATSRRPTDSSSTTTTEATSILRRERAGRLGEAYPLYRDRARDIESQLFRRSFSNEPRIRSVGVWDTVGSVGILQPAATAAVSRESGEVAPGPCRPARGQVLKRARSGGTPNDLRVMASRATGSGPEQDGR